MARERDYDTIPGAEALAESAGGGLKVSIPDGKETWTLWIPQSAISPDSEVWKKGHKGKLVVASSLMLQKVEERDRARRHVDHAQTRKR